MRLSVILLPVATAFAPNALVTRCSTNTARCIERRVDGTPLHLFPDNCNLQFTPSSVIIGDKDIALEDAFSDEIDFIGDPTVRLLFAGFGVLVVLAIAAKFFLNQMDAAIEKVLVEFESTMKTKYESRWVSIEAKLEGLEEPERSQKLFEIMEALQQTEPAFMEKVNRDMGM